ncbi:hypothetical protein ACF061_03880 [Streptomyces sp. NPDC015220]|uniref:hypothetical protein n=1 Tax=Streptomyces sp. NPDC015220 TaxID=3364947 RepID=UPI003701DAD9
MRTHENSGRTPGTPPVSSVRSNRGPHALAALQSTAGNAAVSRMITVSRMMNEDEFKQSTSTTLGKRDRSEIVKVDRALAAFYALPDGAGPAARHLALKHIIRACRDYTARKGEGARVAGTRELDRQAGEAREQLDSEQVFRGLLDEIDGVMREGGNPDLDNRALGGEAQDASRAIPADRFHTMMGEFVRKLGALRDDPALPQETNDVIGELMAVVPLVTVMQYPRGGMPGMKLGQDAGTYTFNVDTQARGGTSFLLGHVAHELTHVAAHQAFGSSPVMELVRSGASDEEVAALATERRQTLDGLRAAMDGTAAFDDFQRGLLAEKLVYGAQPKKLEKYALGFAAAGKITEEQKVRLLAWDAAAGNASGTLVEYDTVLNQMLIYMHMWGIPQNEPFYVQLRAAAAAAFDRRSQARASVAAEAAA